MADPRPVLAVNLHPEKQVELLVANVPLARALFEGVPCARLLARTQLGRDARDLAAWDALLFRLSAGSADPLERVLRAISRHLRAAEDEGPLSADDGAIAALVYAVCATDQPTSGDASLAEIFAQTNARKLGDEAVARACGQFDERLAPAQTSSLRVPMFEVCVRLATLAAVGPWPYGRVLEAMSQLAATEMGIQWAPREGALLFPRGFDDADANMVIFDRSTLDILVARDPRELAWIIDRGERAHKEGESLPSPASPDGRRARWHLDTFLADLAALLKRSGELVVAVKLAGPDAEEMQRVSSIPASPSERPSSTPVDWSQPSIAATLADSFERGQITLAKLRGLVSRGGEPALDVLGAEMLRAPLHPTASAAFAEILARSARPRDIIRLVTYFAIAPDAPIAARALSECDAPELPSVLKAWLEAMLPSDGAAAPFGDDPHTSSAARVTACVASLAPYPHLYRAVRPLLSRLSEAPAAPARS